MGQIINATSAFIEDNNGNKVNISGINFDKNNLTPIQQATKNNSLSTSWILPAGGGSTTDNKGLPVYTVSYTMPYTINDIYYNSLYSYINVTFNNTDSNLGYWGANSYYGVGSSDPNASFSGNSPSVFAKFPIQSLLNGQTVSVVGWSSNNQYISYIYIIVEVSVKGNVLTINYGFYYSNANNYISGATNTQYASAMLNGVVPPSSNLNAGWFLGSPMSVYPFNGQAYLSY